MLQEVTQEEMEQLTGVTPARFLPRVKRLNPMYFPEWVEAPTPCTVRSMSVVITGDDHGARKWVRTHPVYRPGYYGDPTVRVY